MTPKYCIVLTSLSSKDIKQYSQALTINMELFIGTANGCEEPSEVRALIQSWKIKVGFSYHVYCGLPEQELVESAYGQSSVVLNKALHFLKSLVPNFKYNPTSTQLQFMPDIYKKTSLIGYCLIYEGREEFPFVI